MKRMDTKPFEDLQGDSRNPRYMTDFDANNLANSMQQFGDLGGIVWNRRNGKLVGGHMRVATLQKLMGHKQITYTTKYDQPDEQGTVALGYVWLDNTPYAYREVDWPEATHLEANIAANKIDGNWNMDLLAQVNQEILELGGELTITGQSDEEIEALLKATGPEPEVEPDGQSGRADDGLKPIHARFTDDQLATVYEAIGLMKHKRTLTGELNADLDANALYYICRHYVETHTSQNIAPADPTDEQDTPLDQLPAAA